MIRILLSLAIAAAAYFGPWIIDATGTITNSMPGATIEGMKFAETTADCFIDLTFSVSGDCAPGGGLMGQLMTYTVIAGVVSAVLNILGLLPVIGRVTSILTILTGALAVVTFALFAKDLLMIDGASLSDFRWGGYAVGAFGLLAALVGMSGLKGDEHR
ncbi:hypothetical protein [Parvularcula sp. LCG005]|uniref:hypothetical protein n=1 Tax=Parvularcula sp. LCG005 TaxID=3078805 RepID=UPI002942FA26|nr:hypothetical protein [Parvularcula sp. LCG005]WOI52520.1 hypothetical protein RUI03_10215 [Parvularcula sp. LCG005]